MLKTVFVASTATRLCLLFHRNETHVANEQAFFQEQLTSLNVYAHSLVMPRSILSSHFPFAQCLGIIHWCLVVVTQRLALCMF
jgi:hypothetical protein